MIDEEVLSVAWNLTNLMDWCMSDDDKKVTEATFTEKC